MLIGRTRELEAAWNLLGRVSAGRGAMLVLAGEAGIGKTRLADEIAGRALQQGFTVAWARAWETGGAPAYFPWSELLLALQSTGFELPPAAAGIIYARASAGPGERAAVEPERQRFELFEHVLQHLRACARRAPLLLVFDDLQAADLASLELLAFVARGFRGLGIALLVTYRDVEARAGELAGVIGRIVREGEQLPLHRLSAEDVAELVRHEFGHFDAAFSAELHALTEGNPLLLRETLISVGPQAATPEMLRAVAGADGVLWLVRERLARVKPETRHMLELVAIAGREIDLATCAEACEVTQDVAVAFCDEATARGLFSPRAEALCRFSHVLVREAVYRTLALERRRELHSRLAAVLARRVAAGRVELLSQLAHHALSALSSGDAEGALEIVRRAAERSRSQLAFDDAIRLLERAFECCAAQGIVVSAHSRLEVVLALGWAHTEAGHLERGRELFREVTQQARALGNPVLLARAALGQGGEYVLAEIRDELVELLREALTGLSSATLEQQRLKARVQARLAAALTPSPRPEEPLQLAREALAMLNHEADARVRIDVHVSVGAAFSDFAPPLERVPVNQRLRQDALQVGDRVLELRALTRLVCDYLEGGDPLQADLALEARATLADQLGQPRQRWQTPLLRSMRAMPSGRFEVCEALVEEARALAAEANDPNARRCIEVHRYNLLAEAGRPEGRQEQLSALLEAFGSLPGRTALSALYATKAPPRPGEPERVLATMRGLKDTLAMRARFSRVWLAEIAARCQAREECEEVYAEFDPRDAGMVCLGPFGFVCGPPVASVLARLALALGRPETALQHCALAAQVCERMGADAQRAWLELVWGRVAQAHEHFQRALELGERLGMPEVISEAQACLAGTPLSASSSAAAPPRFELRREGEYWALSHAGRSSRLRHVRGLDMLARLCEQPGRELHVLELVAQAGEGAVDVGDAGELLDPTARAAYQARIEALQASIDEADAFSDTARASGAREELDQLTQQLAAAFGLGGRARRSGSAAERARTSVQRRVREAIRKIAEHDPELGRHLNWAVRTGTFCAYEPFGKV